jgi:hypothetical protein
MKIEKDMIELTILEASETLRNTKERPRHEKTKR